MILIRSASFFFFPLFYVIAAKDTGFVMQFELMKDYLQPGLGGNIIDASCGSGLFSRLFAKSGLFSHVVALDYSENMLRQCYEFIMQEENFPKEYVSILLI